MRTTQRRRPAGVLLVVLAALLAGCSEAVDPSENDARPPKVRKAPAVPSDLSLPVRPAMLLEPSADSSSPQQVGRAPVALTYAELNGGRVRAGEGVGRADAFSFPAFRKDGPYPRAVLTATPTTEKDDLTPGNRDFQFGADIRLDPVSTGRSEDDGNNIIQRGLAVDAVMFKLEVDANHRPSCTVKGRLGEVTVYALDALKPRTWYRVRCDRQANLVTIFVGEFLPSGATTVVGRGAIGKIGPVDIRDPLLPVSVGGKVSRSGAIVRDATDQFNGEIANPFIVFP